MQNIRPEDMLILDAIAYCILHDLPIPSHRELSISTGYTTTEVRASLKRLVKAKLLTHHKHTKRSYAIPASHWTQYNGQCFYLIRRE